MPAEVEPPELALLLNLAERPRTGDWSLRSALVRYAQPEPARVSQLLEQVRRLEWALQPHLKRLETEGPQLWAQVIGDTPEPSPDVLVGILRAALELDHLGDELAAWAVDPSVDRPNRAVDDTVSDVKSRLDTLGIGHEEREPPPRRRAPR